MMTSQRTATALLLVAMFGAGGCAGLGRPPAEALRAEERGDCGPGPGDDAVAAARELMDSKVPRGPAVFRGAVDVCGVDEIEVGVRRDPAPPRVSSKVFFRPTVLVGEPGQELTVVLTHDGKSKTHNFSIDELNISEPILSSDEHGIGSETRVSVTFPTDGEPLLFYCRFHRVGGMWGALVAPR